MSHRFHATGHQPVEPDQGPGRDVEQPLKDEPNPTKAPQRKHHDPEDPGFDDAD